jgi:iron complex outermembrane receptor protein
VDVRSSALDQAPDLAARSATGSRLGLSVRETPASVEVITQEVMERRGAGTLVEALRGAAGVTAGGAPGSPGIASMRGFTGNAVVYLYDGSPVSQAAMSSRPQDSFNFDRIEVLKGPASVLFGTGAVGGVVNFVTKRPDRNNIGTDFMVSYGSFNTLRLGAGMGMRLGESGALRVDYSRRQSDGYVQRSREVYDHFTIGAAFDLTPSFKAEVSLDYLRDDIKAYWGTPIVPTTFATDPTGVVTTTSGAPRVIDRRMAFSNFNVLDARMDSQTYWWRGKLSWAITPEWTLNNELSYFTAQRRWRNAEVYTFAAPANMNRSQVDISHDHQITSNRLDARYSGLLAGMQTRFLAGVEITETRFNSNRVFSDGTAATNTALRVSAIDPQVGLYNPSLALATGAGNNTRFVTGIPTSALFTELAVKPVSSLTLVAGLRQDTVKLDRQIQDFNANTTTNFNQSYTASSGRLGLIYEVLPGGSVYAQYTDASNPVGTLLLLNAANSVFPLSRGKQTEVGFKQSVGDVFDWTLSAYDIKLDNILTRDSANPNNTIAGGAQSSRGVELAANWRATRQFTLSGNLAALTAKYDRLVEGTAAAPINRAGNRPPNVPLQTLNLWADYRFANSPLSVGASMNRVGSFFTSNANDVRVNGYTTYDAYARWSFDKATSLTFRVRNLTNQLYATWAGAGASQVIIGAPRSFELMLRTSF